MSEIDNVYLVGIKIVFLLQIKDFVKDEPENLVDVVHAVNAGIRQRIEIAVDLQSKAEYALMMCWDGIYKKKTQQGKACKKQIMEVLANSGAFRGTDYAEKLKKDLKKI